MIISLASKKPSQMPRLPPMDFYRFNHTCEVVNAQGQGTALSRPLWIVGVSPFDPVTQEDEGYVVHLGSPSFVARWTLIEATMAQIKQPEFFDEDLNIMVYEVAQTGGAGAIPQEWLLEAACAVAYSKGMIAVATHDETH